MPFKPEEYYYLHLLIIWEKEAPPDRHRGNTQTARMARLLRIAVGINDATFQRLAKRTQRKDGRSYVSKDKDWMREPYEIGRGWYFEGNMSLEDKHAIIKDLPSLGIISAALVPCAQDFVAGKSLQKYVPDEDEARRTFQKWVDDDRYWVDAENLRSSVQRWLDKPPAPKGERGSL